MNKYAKDFMLGSGAGGWLFLDESSIVQMIQLVIGNSDLTLGEVIDIYDSPKEVVFCGRHPEHTTLWFVNLLYPDSGLVLSLYDLDAGDLEGINFDLQPGAIVYEIFFVVPGLDEYFDYISTYHPGIIELDWAGYGIYTHEY
jgi:hypothetical protein